MTRPTALTVLVDNIPDALRAVARWVCWRYVWDGTRWSKRPFQSSNRPAKSNDPRMWSTFQKVVVAYRAGCFDGIGFVLGDGWAGIDFDHCHQSPDSIPLPVARPFLNALPCYSEISPSETGVKAIGRSARIGGEIKFDREPPAVTTWSGARYVAVTGAGEGDPAADITPLLDTWFPASRVCTALPTDRPEFLREHDVRGTENLERFTDDQVVERVLVSPQTEKFVRLVRGDLSDYGQDHSRADQGFFGIVVYYCQGDLEQAERLFRQTKLLRPKWGGSYRRATLRKAAQL